MKTKNTAEHKMIEHSNPKNKIERKLKKKRQKKKNK